jgi:hypothetical protein
LEYTSAWLEDPVVELASLRTAIEEIQARPLRTLRRSNAAVGELATTLDSQSLLYWVDKVRAKTNSLPYSRLPGACGVATATSPTHERTGRSSRPYM